MDNHLNNPLVSVVMPVYNGEKYLRSAIQSILNQTYQNFEFLIINDGSNDNTHSIISSFNDKRIKYISNSENLRLVKSLNIGIKEAKGKYVARMDADDISFPERFEKQVGYLESHDKCGVLGTGAVVINDSGESTGNFIKKTENEVIKWQLMFSCQFIHPSVMLRRELFDKAGYYQQNESEDLDLWERLLHFTDFANLEECLLYYRMHNSERTRQSPYTMAEDANQIFKRYRESVLKRKLSDNSSLLIDSFFRKQEFNSLNDLKEAVEISTQLFNSYIKINDKDIVKEDFANSLFYLALKYKKSDSKYCTGLLKKSFQIYPSLYFKIHSFNKLIKFIIN